MKNIFKTLIKSVAALVLAACGAISTPAQSAFRFDNVVFKPSGGFVSFAKITVCNGASFPLVPCTSGNASLFSDPLLSIPLGNPVTSDVNGNYGFYVSNNQNYTITVTAAGFSGYSVAITPIGEGAGNPGGTDTAVQFNNAGGFGGNASLLAINKSTGIVTGTGLNLPASAPYPSSDVALLASGHEIYVGWPGASDSNNGFSRGTSMATWFHAACSLPGGNCSAQIAGSGTIYILDGASWNATSTCGAWIMGSADPNFSSPPACWLKQANGSSSITTIGVASNAYGPNPHLGRAQVNGGSAADRNHPGIWESGVTTMVFKNIAVTGPGRGIVIGECSNNTRTNTCNSSGDKFDNVTVNLTSAVGNGPGWDITGESFWIFLTDCGGSGLDTVNAPTSDNAAAILIDGRNNGGNGLIFIKDLNTANGGIKFYSGATNGGSLSVDGMTTEAQHGEPAVEFVSNPAGADFFVHASIQHIVVADSFVTNPALENDSIATVKGDDLAGQGLNVVGNVIVGSEYQNNLQDQTISPLQYGQTGFIGQFGGVWNYGLRDDVQRESSLHPVRFPNDVVGSDCSTWTATQFSGTTTLTCGIADPYGGTNAGQASNAGGSLNEGIEFLPGGTENINLTVGEYIVAGVWTRSATANGYPGTPLGGANINVVGTGFTISGTCGGDSYLGDGQWTWNRCIFKVTSVGTNPAGLNFGAFFDSTHTVQAAYPVINFILPSAGISPNEVYNYYNSLSPYDSDCTVGSECGVNLPVVFPGPSVTAPIFNAVTGFQIGGAAPLGHCLLGNGSVYVDSTSCGGGGGSSAWSSLTASLANTTISQSNFQTLFSYNYNVTTPSNLVMWEWQNTSASTSTSQGIYPLLEFGGTEWSGSISDNETWTVGPTVPLIVPNPPEYWDFIYSGANTGQRGVRVPNLIDYGISGGAFGNCTFWSVPTAGTGVMLADEGHPCGPNGSSTAIQFVSSSGAFSGDATNFAWNDTNLQLAQNGQYTLTGIANPAAPTLTINGTAGTTTITYAVVGVQGAAPTASASQTTSTANATLSGTNFVAVATSAVTGSTNCKVYRTATNGTSPTTTGLIGTVACGATLNDTGLAGDGTSPSTINQTGQISAQNYLGPINIEPMTFTTDVNPLNLQFTFNNVSTTFNGLKWVNTATAFHTGSFAYQFCTGLTGNLCMTLDPQGNLTVPGTITSSASGPGLFDVGTQGAFTRQVFNNPTTATVLNQAACMIVVGGLVEAENCPLSSPGEYLGAVFGQAGTSGNAQIAYAGITQMVFDGGTIIAGDYVQLSTTVAGEYHDTGSTTRPTSGGPIAGVVHQSASGTAPLTTLVDVDVLPNNSPSSGGGTPPASAHVLGSNGSSAFVAATATDSSAILFSSGGGTAQAQTLTLAPAISSYTTGLRVCWLPVAANTGSGPTLAVNGLAAITIVKEPGNAALIANDLTTTSIACVVYDGTNFELQGPQTFPRFDQILNPTSAVTVTNASGTSWTFTNSAVGDTPLIINGISGQTGDLLDLNVNGSNKISFKPSGNAVFSGSTTQAGSAISGASLLEFSGSSTSVSQAGVSFVLVNATTTGTVLNETVQLTGAPSTLVVGTASATSGIIGICAASCGTAGSGVYVDHGFIKCVFSNATTAGDYVVPSATAGNCSDAGSARPASGEILGRVLSTNGAGGTFTIFMQLENQ